MTRFSVVITFKQFYASIKIFDWKYKRILFYFSHVPRRHNIYKEWRLLQNMGKMESHYITVRNCTYHIKKEFLRLFQKILVWGNNKKRRSFPSLPNLTAKKHNPTFCDCGLPQVAFCNCKPLHYTQHFHLGLSKHWQIQIKDKSKIYSNFWMISSDIKCQYIPLILKLILILTANVDFQTSQLYLTSPS